MGKRYYINNGWEFTEHWSDAFLCQGSREEGGSPVSGVPNGAAAGQRRAGGALAGAYLVRKGGVKLLIQRDLFVRLQFYHTASPNWPHKKFKNWAFIQSQSSV